MEALENDNTGPQGQGELIREIGRSECRLAGACSPEQHLMRLAGDPLLVREFLLRKDPAEPVHVAASPMSGEVTVALARRMLSGLQRAGGLSGSKQYDPLKAPFEASVAPSVFEPSHQDREGALEHDGQQLVKVAPAALVSRPGVALVGVPFVAALVLLLLLLLFPN